MRFLSIYKPDPGGPGRPPAEKFLKVAGDETILNPIMEPDDAPGARGEK
jgi:hypothetical protein